MFFQPLVECSASLSNVRPATCPTGNLIDYSCFLRWSLVFELHQGLSECLVQAEADSAKWRTYGSVMVALAESIHRILATLDDRVCFRPHRTLRQPLVQLKDHTPPEKKAGVVYRIPCGTCGRAYIGQTGWTLNR